MNKKVAFYTLGCKLNFSETSYISNQLKDNGYIKVNFEDKPDIFIINTCSVTNNADKQCRNIIKNAININKYAFIIVIGCYAQLKPKEIINIKGVDLVLGTQQKFNIIKYLSSIDYYKNKNIITGCDIDKSINFINSFSLNENRTRSFLKIQDGCDYKCTYCTIPKARGISRSDKVENIINNIKTISKKGVKEIVLTGVNIGDFGKGEYGNKNHSHSFLELLKEIDSLQNIERIRISSIEPNLLKEDIINLIARSKKIMPHFHIPLQSGSDDILKKMKRRYLTSLYKEKVYQIKYKIPNSIIGADVIVGFPGENEYNFLETYNFIKDIPINYLHIFTFSERENTPAAYMTDKVDIIDKKHRNKMLTLLSMEKKHKFYLSQKNILHKVLWEKNNKNNKLYGYTENYIKVNTKYNDNYINKITTVKLLNIDNDGSFSCKII